MKSLMILLIVGVLQGRPPLRSGVGGGLTQGQLKNNPLDALPEPVPPSQSETVIDVDDIRPLAAAADKLEHQYGVAIDYEDVHSLDPDTIRAVTRGQIPAGKTLKIRIPKDRDQRPLDTPGTVLERTVQQHKANGNRGEFRVRQVNERRFTLLPTAAKNKAGQLRAERSPLDTPVSFPAQERTLFQAVNLVMEAIGSGLASAPLNTFSRTMTNVGAANEPARDVLIRIFNEGQPGDFPLLSWRLLCDDKACLFNVHTVVQEVFSPRTGQAQFQIVPRLQSPYALGIREAPSLSPPPRIPLGATPPVPGSRTSDRPAGGKK